MREISKTQKLQITTIIIVCSLIIYAIGIATDFFGSPVFSMFFIISNETAHNVVSSVAIVTAITLTIIALDTWIIRKRKTAFPETHNKPVIQTIKTPDETSVKLTSPANNPKITKYLESKKTEQKRSSKQPNTDKNATTNQEATINKDKITCPKCKKEFSTPLYTVDYSSGNPTIIRVCPFCNQTLDSQPKNNAEDLWVRNFRTP